MHGGCGYLSKGSDPFERWESGMGNSFQLLLKTCGQLILTCNIQKFEPYTSDYTLLISKGGHVNVDVVG
jgi:hypothetical protein